MYIRSVKIILQVYLRRIIAVFKHIHDKNETLIFLTVVVNF